MSLFGDDRASELRDLFFESAQELLQALNEQGLLLEQRPDNAEVVRGVRRTVHTLKGDSAACGFRELSELAHEVEDVLTAEVAARAGARVAQVVLSAADIFDAMLAAYRAHLQLPSGEPLRVLVRGLAQPQGTQDSQEFPPKFEWTEYERLDMEQAAGPGTYVYNVALEIDPQCPMRSAALQLVRNVLQDAGAVLAMRPDEAAAGTVEVVQAALASEHDQEWIEKKCVIPAVSRRVVVEIAYEPSNEAEEEASEQPMLAVLEEQDALAHGAPQQAAISRVAADSMEADTAHHHASAASAPENVLRVDAERIDTVLNLVGELIIGKSMLNQALSELAKRFPKDPLRNRFADALAFQAQVLNQLQRSVMKIRMVPVEQLFRRFPRVVRDLSKSLGKDVELIISGQNTDLDKRILDSLAEPLTHLMRNAVDHGIETAEVRQAAGKPARGRIRLDAYHQGNQVVVEVSDDGAGIDAQAVAQTAVERGLMTAASAASLSEGERLELVFEPGFSTRKQVTEMSGRGVGMDVVKSALERVKGSVVVESRPGRGTSFLLRVPLTLAIIKALLFRVSGRLWAVPLAAVQEIARATENDIHRVDEHEVLRLREEVLTLVRLSSLPLNHANGNGAAAEPVSPRKKVFVIVISIAGRKFGLVVDRPLGEEELVIKALDDHLVATELVSGASILGDGTVVLILNTSAVVQRLGRPRALPAKGDSQLPGEADRVMGAEA